MGVNIIYFYTFFYPLLFLSSCYPFPLGPSISLEPICYGGLDISSLVAGLILLQFTAVVPTYVRRECFWNKCWFLPPPSPPLPLPVPPSLGLVRNVENPFAKDSKNGLFPYISRNPLFSFTHICVLIFIKSWRRSDWK